MLSKLRLLGLSALLLCFVTSCAMFQDSPDKVFQVVGLNSNLLPTDLSRHFKEVRQHKANGSLQMVDPETRAMKDVTAVEYFDFLYGKRFEDVIAKVSALKDSEEVTPIKNAALETFKAADAIYQTDFPPIAKMIDADAPDAEIDAAIAKLQETKGADLVKKYETTMGLLLPYAARHGVEFKTIEMP